MLSLGWKALIPLSLGWVMLTGIVLKLVPAFFRGVG
jgi:NADH:ubiquinone oxidoreductase subunit H